VSVLAASSGSESCVCWIEAAFSKAAPASWSGVSVSVFSSVVMRGMGGVEGFQKAIGYLLCFCMRKALAACE
jgi:hypothetical protein